MNASRNETLIIETVHAEPYIFIGLMSTIIFCYIVFRCCGIYQRRETVKGQEERSSRRGSRMAL